MKLYHKNPRQITDKQFTDLGGSLSRLGDLGGIVHDLNSDEIIGGNQRSRVFDINQCEIELKEQYLDPDEQGTVGLGFVIWKGKKYAYRQVRWTAKQCEEANIRANKNGGSFDFDTLANEFELDDLLEWGFERKELDLDLWAGDKPDDPGAQIDKAEELREKWGVESGQLWRLGEHRLICGDCTDKAVVERVMQGEKAGAVVTDPPYGINLDTDYSNPDGRGAFRGRQYPPVIGDDKPFDAGFLRDVFKDANEQFWFGANYYYRTLGVPDGDGSWLVWDKRVEEAKDAVIGSAFELCWSATKHAQRIIRYQWTNWTSHNNAGMHREHPTEKPIPVIEEIINRWINDDGFIIDPFSGSGTTLIACERLGRKCRAIEISPAYCAVAIQRWVDMTGGIPELLDVQT